MTRVTERVYTSVIYIVLIDNLRRHWTVPEGVKSIFKQNVTLHFTTVYGGGKV